jgi:sugar-specific transcriptional regulator TrmB
MSGAVEEVLREDIRSGLRGLGLSSSAASALVALMSRSSASATAICNEAGIPDSKVYYALEELRSKGMITVQYGTPNLYRALSPREALANLKRQLAEEYAEKARRADELARKLEAIRVKAGGSGEVELAYIIKGERNVLGRMNELIANARREVVALISGGAVLEKILRSLHDADRRGVKIYLAAPKTLLRKISVKDLGEVRRLLCECCMLAVDQSILLVVSNWNSSDMHAMMTQDRSLIALAARNFSNPNCCA